MHKAIYLVFRAYEAHHRCHILSCSETDNSVFVSYSETTFKCPAMVYTDYEAGNNL